MQFGLIVSALLILLVSSLSYFLPLHVNSNPPDLTIYSWHHFQIMKDKTMIYIHILSNYYSLYFSKNSKIFLDFNFDFKLQFSLRFSEAIIHSSCCFMVFSCYFSALCFIIPFLVFCFVGYLVSSFPALMWCKLSLFGDFL